MPQQAHMKPQASAHQDVGNMGSTTVLLQYCRFLQEEAYQTGLCSTVHWELVPRKVVRGRGATGCIYQSLLSATSAIFGVCTLLGSTQGPSLFDLIGHTQGHHFC